MSGTPWYVRITTWGAAWMVQSVKRQTLGFSSGHHLTVREWGPRIELCADGTEAAWDSLSLSLSPQPLHLPWPEHSLKINK